MNIEKEKVVLGMSGGVDSSVAAYLLQKQGYEVVGFFMNANPSGNSKMIMSISWSEEEKMVRKICDRLGIELHVVDCSKGYETKVLGSMFKDYRRGLTPNPDTLCNKIGKFPKMLELAKKVGAKFISTGHYVRVKDGNLFRGKDENKDQSYFLIDLKQNVLKKCLFPIGELTKDEVRKFAKKIDFPNWDKRSSRGICYLGKIDMKKLLKINIEEKLGKVFDVDGNVIGVHPGIMFFTIGERIGDKKGFKIEKKFLGKKLYVAEKLKGNKLVVAPEGHLALKRKFVFIKGFHWIGEEVRTGLKARIRHLGELYNGKLKKLQNKWTFEFSAGVEGVAAGQGIVLYSGERLVGGGEIRLE